jgi:hypothetical protein
MSRPRRTVFVLELWDNDRWVYGYEAVRTYVTTTFDEARRIAAIHHRISSEPDDIHHRISPTTLKGRP